jgi:hypothetical protein
MVAIEGNKQTEINLLDPHSPCVLEVIDEKRRRRGRRNIYSAEVIWSLSFKVPGRVESWQDDVTLRPCTI